MCKSTCGRVFSILLGRYLGAGLLGNSVFNFLGNCQTVSHSVCSPEHASLSVIESLDGHFLLSVCPVRAGRAVAALVFAQYGAQYLAGIR